MLSRNAITSAQPGSDGVTLSSRFWTDWREQFPSAIVANGTAFEVVWTVNVAFSSSVVRNEVHRAMLNDDLSVRQPDAGVFAYFVDSYLSTEAVRAPLRVSGGRVFGAYTRMTPESPFGNVMRVFLRDLSEIPRRSRVVAK